MRFKYVLLLPILEISAGDICPASPMADEIYAQVEKYTTPSCQLQPWVSFCYYRLWVWDQNT